jgi:ribosome biogenesis GTPase / thiamine phosphate phosphatase
MREAGRAETHGAAAGTLPEGLVISCHRRHFVVRQDDGDTVECVLKGRNLTLACGDRVSVARSGGGNAIEAIGPRTSLFYRSDAFKEKLIAANVTQVIGVVAPGLSLDLELVDRWTVAAESERCRFVLAANKSDLPDFDVLVTRLEPYVRLGYPVVALSAKRSAEPLRPWLEGQHTVLIGQSGMGKSTILNAVAPEAGAKTADVSAALATGRHTTSHSTLHALSGDRGGWIVDSPGIKAFGLAHLPPEAIAQAFVELRPFLGQCRFRDCRHDREPGCAVSAAVVMGRVAPHRVALLHALVAASALVRTPGR